MKYNGKENADWHNKDREYRFTQRKNKRSQEKYKRDYKILESSVEKKVPAKYKIWWESLNNGQKKTIVTHFLYTYTHNNKNKKAIEKFWDRKFDDFTPEIDVYRKNKIRNIEENI